MQVFTYSFDTNKFGNIVLELERDGEWNATYSSTEGQTREEFINSMREEVKKQTNGQIIL